MKNIIRKVSEISLATAVALSLATPAFAQADLNPCKATGGSANQYSALCKLDATKTGAVISNLIIIAFIVAGLLALAFLIWGGIRWILSGGDKAKVEEARKTLTAALIGLVVVFLSYFLLNLILSLFGINLTTGFTIPKIVP